MPFLKRACGGPELGRLGRVGGRLNRVSLGLPAAPTTVPVPPPLPLPPTWSSSPGQMSFLPPGLPLPQQKLSLLRLCCQAQGLPLCLGVTSLPDTWQAPRIRVVHFSLCFPGLSRVAAEYGRVASLAKMASSYWL